MEVPQSQQRSPTASAAIFAGGLALILVVGLLDFLTGSEISFSVFYLAPTALLAWKGGRLAGLLGAAAAAGVWLVVDSLSAVGYSHPLIIYWNASVRLVFFIITVQLIGRQRLVYSLECQLSRTDNLTGLMNVRSFFQEGEKLRELCARHARPLTVIYIDLDDFKRINDSRGHQEGDRLIRLVGKGLRRAVRASDLAARLGGDEFALLLPETGFNEAENFIARLQQCLDAEVDRASWGVDYSAGAVTFGTVPADLESATAMADRLMYEAKGAGKGFWVHRPAPDAGAPARLGTARVGP